MPVAVAWLMACSCLPWLGCRSCGWGSLVLEPPDDLAEELHVLHVVLRRRLDRRAVGHARGEGLELVRVGVLEVRPDRRAPELVADRLLEVEGRREVADVGGVVLHAQRRLLAVHLEVGVETHLLVDTG